MRRGFNAEAILGRCIFCKYVVREGEKRFASRYAKITHGRWICGNCFLGMKDVISEVEEAFTKDEEDDTVHYNVNPQTGKIERTVQTS